MSYNRDLFEGMVLFCAVVEQRGFTAAAKAVGHTPSHVSKEIARLEARLGARLLNRTTRKISLTEPGRAYYERARRMVDDAGAMEERLQALGDRPFGELRMSVPVVFAHGCLNGWLPEFLDRYPEVSLNVDVSERRTDIVAEGIDLVVRIGTLPASDLIVRELFRTRGVAVASPAYLAQFGEPKHPHDLTDHSLIDFSFHGVSYSWSFATSGTRDLSVAIESRVQCNDAQTEKALALAGQGITRLPELFCRKELESGSLVAVLTAFERPPAGVHIIYASRENLAAKTRAMIDFLVEKSRQW